MQANAPLPGQEEQLQERLTAVNRLIEEAQKLIRAQEQGVARIQKAGFDTQHAEALLDAYRACARIAAEEKRQLEIEIARRSSP
jgi:hypothetical protein